MHLYLIASSVLKGGLLPGLPNEIILTHTCLSRIIAQISCRLWGLIEECAFQEL